MSNEVEISPRRRVPLQLPETPSELARLNMEPKVWDELQAEIQEEAQNFKQYQKLTPRKAISGSSPSPLKLQKGSGSPQKASQDEGPRTGLTVGFAALVGLRSLFEEMGKSDVNLLEVKGMRALYLAAQLRDPRILWHIENDTERRIRTRQVEYDDVIKQRTKRANELMQEQQAPKTEYEQFLARCAASKAEMGELTDKEQLALIRLERAAQSDQEKREREQREREALGLTLKQRMAKEREERAERRRQLAKEIALREMDAADDLDAVLELKQKEEEAKRGASTEPGQDSSPAKRIDNKPAKTESAEKTGTTEEPLDFDS